MVDDVASLVILAVLQEIGKNENNADTAGDWAWLIAKPIIISLSVILAGAILCWGVPLFYAWLARAIEARVRHRRSMGPSRASEQHLDLSCAPYVLYGVKYIDLVTLAPCSGPATKTNWRPHRGIRYSGCHAC